jgi:L-fuculose-phosphate aldolase
MSEHELRQEVLRIGRLLHEKNFVAATDGNISARLDSRSILVTPTGMSKGMLRPEDLLLVDPDGHKLAGTREVSTELRMHLLIYRLRADVHAVVHAHPPTATGFAAAGLALDEPLIAEVELSLGRVPLACYALPGTRELCDELAPLIAGHNAILMANHGVVTYGENLLAAYLHMESVEHFARIYLVTHQLGRRSALDNQQLEELRILKKQRAMGTASPQRAGIAADPAQELLRKKA